MSDSLETIVALATPPGKGGVGIIRISGTKALYIAKQITQSDLQPRHATYLNFYSNPTQIIDQGIAIYFKAPHSFTGEEVVELQGHGGPIVLDLLIKRVTELGARMARPGEFSERAFLNDKLDLAQAEAVADLINASSIAAAKSALNSLQGVFSTRVHDLVESLIQLRLFVEAAIDFPEEEINFLSDGKVFNDLSKIIEEISLLQKQAQQGTLLRDGMNVVLAGKPNAGKSSLLNALAGKESAIVTDIPGTTRDILREYIHIDGMPLHIIDTAGLRESNDEVEKIGIQRAWNEIAKSDRLLLVVDATEDDIKRTIETILESLHRNIDCLPPITILKNKCDLIGLGAELVESDKTEIRLSAKNETGMQILKDHLKECMGFQTVGEGTFMARRRHLDAIERAKNHIEESRIQLIEFNAGELVAEELRQAQNALSEITGDFTSDDLLGRIFSSFCIGK